MSKRFNICLVLFFCMGATGSFAQKDFVLLEVGSTVSLNNGESYTIPNVLQFKTTAAETYSLGIQYQRKLSEIFFVSVGTYFTNSPFSYSIRYNWQMTDQKKEWTRTRLNDGNRPALPTLKIPIAVGLEFPLSRHYPNNHRMAISAGLGFSFAGSATSSMQQNYVTEDTHNQTYINDVVAVASNREVDFSFQLSAHLRTTYYFRIPKLGVWSLFFVFEPRITKDKIQTYVALMPGTEYEKILRPDPMNHTVWLGLGHRFGKRPRP